MLIILPASPDAAGFSVLNSGPSDEICERLAVVKPLPVSVSSIADRLMKHGATPRTVTALQVSVSSIADRLMKRWLKMSHRTVFCCFSVLNSGPSDETSPLLTSISRVVGFSVLNSGPSDETIKCCSASSITIVSVSSIADRLMKRNKKHTHLIITMFQCPQ